MDVGPYMGALLRAFTKTLAERHHAMVILDAPNSRAAEFREFWHAGQVQHAIFCCIAYRNVPNDRAPCYWHQLRSQSSKQTGLIAGPTNDMLMDSQSCLEACEGR